MKPIAIAIVVALALGNAGLSAAQGRHDDKPHGQPAKPVEEKMMAEPRVHPGGRHDAQSHKNAIAVHNRALAKKKAAEEAAASATAPKEQIAK